MSPCPPTRTSPVAMDPPTHRNGRHGENPRCHQQRRTLIRMRLFLGCGILGEVGLVWLGNSWNSRFRWPELTPTLEAGDAFSKAQLFFSKVSLLNFRGVYVFISLNKFCFWMFFEKMTLFSPGQHDGGFRVRVCALVTHLGNKKWPGEKKGWRKFDSTYAAEWRYESEKTPQEVHFPGVRPIFSEGQVVQASSSLFF